MDVRHLLTFRAVLREGSFLGAARALQVSQPTVTLHIQELEAEFRQALFVRGGRRRPLTPGGELFAARAMPILDAFDSLTESMAEFGDGRSGLLKIGAIEPAASQRVTPLLGRLHAERPMLRVRLDVSGTAGVSRGVADSELDLVCVRLLPRSSGCVSSRCLPKKWPCWFLAAIGSPARSLSSPRTWRASACS